ncbi:MAG: hypothetical protein QOI69_1057, partial [Pseudonocardiales bacterium]|nr:hypothetical protein [Pseudonocardiales bacterium]
RTVTVRAASFVGVATAVELVAAVSGGSAMVVTAAGGLDACLPGDAELVQPVSTTAATAVIAKALRHPTPARYALGAVGNVTTTR